MRIYGMMLLLLASTTSWAQTDSSKVNQLSVGLDFMTHGEACGGGMPKTDNENIEVEDRSRFLLGRTDHTGTVCGQVHLCQHLPDAGGHRYRLHAGGHRAAPEGS